jgi:hypothetical protein
MPETAPPETLRAEDPSRERGHVQPGRGSKNVRPQSTEKKNQPPVVVRSSSSSLFAA